MSFNSKRITQSGSKEFGSHSKDPELKITLRFDNSGESEKITLIDHPESWIKLEELSSIAMIAQNTPENYLSRAKGNLDVFVNSLKFFLRDSTEKNLMDNNEVTDTFKVFLKQMQYSEQIASTTNQMLPLNFPKQLVGKIRDSIALELDYYFLKYKTALNQFYTFNYDEENDVHTLSFAFGDGANKEMYYEYELQQVEGAALRSLTTNQLSGTLRLIHTSCLHSYFT